MQKPPDGQLYFGGNAPEMCAAPECVGRRPHISSREVMWMKEPEYFERWRTMNAEKLERDRRDLQEDPMDKIPAVSFDGYTIKDSGEKMKFESGMVRDTVNGKPKFELALDGPMFKRWAWHLTRACRNVDGTPGKYPTRNWMKATGDAELDRFIESAFHHFVQWLDGETDEDHAAAVFFNINGAEYVRERMRQDAMSRGTTPRE